MKRLTLRVNRAFKLGNRRYEAGDVFEADLITAISLTRKRLVSKTDPAHLSVPEPSSVPPPEVSLPSFGEEQETTGAGNEDTSAVKETSPAPVVVVEHEEQPEQNQDPPGQSSPPDEPQVDPDAPAPPKTRRRRYERRDLEAEP